MKNGHTPGREKKEYKSFLLNCGGHIAKYRALNSDRQHMKL